MTYKSLCKKLVAFLITFSGSVIYHFISAVPSKAAEIIILELIIK